MSHVRTAFTGALLTIGAAALSACTRDTPERDTPERETPERDAPQRTISARAAAESATRVAGVTFVIRDTTIAVTVDASGVAEPMQQAALSSKLMGTVLAVLVREGDVVQSGQPLVRIDARELSAKSVQLAAAIADAEAQQKEAAAHATRVRALYADSAATRAQFDAAQTGLTRAEAGVHAARAAASEVDVLASYATVRAPFAGVVSARTADPGIFASPGVPLLTVQDVSSLRIRVTVSADAVRQLKRGQKLTTTIDGAVGQATVEGIVSANAGNLFAVNAIVPNRAGAYRAGSAATLFIPTGTQSALLVPVSAIVREGDLTGVIVRGAQRDERRWIRTGVTVGSQIEITSGLHAGEQIVIPARSGG